MDDMIEVAGNMMFAREVNIEIEYSLGIGVGNGHFARLKEVRLEIEGPFILFFDVAKEEDISKNLDVR